jgi:hypothetical protein
MSVAVIGLLFASTAALAATDKGIINKIDAKGDSITLTDGKVFNLTENVEAEQMKVGTKVIVTYHKKAGKLLATAVHVVK